MSSLQFDAETHRYTLNGEFLPSVTQLMKPITEHTYDDIAVDVLENAARIGTEVHRIIEFYEVTGVYEEDEELDAHMKSYLKWRETNDMRVLFTEHMMSSPEGFAGTMDIIYNTIDGIGVMDIKTSKKITPKPWAVQLAGYARLAKANGIDVVERSIIRVDGKLKTAKLYILSPEEVAMGDHVFDALLTIHQYMKEG